MTRHVVAVDWGTTSLRAYVIDRHARIVASNKTPSGIQKRSGSFEATLADAISALPVADDAPILMAGMVGSRQGWIEAPYVETPCDVRHLAQGLTEVPNSLGRPVRIVPGLCDLSGSAPDVMRGEETQLLGVLHGRGEPVATVCMPGTHCKWVQADAGRIISFKTYMTGEVFGLLSDQSILARLMQRNGPDDADDWPAFDQGLEASESGHVLNHIFAARTLGLFERMPASALKSYLSGILIGHETRAAASNAQAPVILVGDRRLTARYQRALTKLDLSHQLADENIVVEGLALIAVTARLI